MQFPNLEKRLKDLEELAYPAKASPKIVHYIKNLLNIINQIRSELGRNTPAEEVISRSHLLLGRFVSGIQQPKVPEARLPAKPSNLAFELKIIVSLLERPFNQKGIKIKLSGLNAVQSLMVDIHLNELRALLFNLILNAQEAMPEGGNLSISVSVENNFAQLIISDTGFGISKSDLDNIFKPNFTTKMGGSGLGLTFSSEIVKTAGGSISVKSRLGQGTTFIMKLPIDPNHCYDMRAKSRRIRESK